MAGLHNSVLAHGFEFPAKPVAPVRHETQQTRRQPGVASLPGVAVLRDDRARGGRAAKGQEGFVAAKTPQQVTDPTSTKRVVSAYIQENLKVVCFGKSSWEMRKRLVIISGAKGV